MAQFGSQQQDAYKMTLANYMSTQNYTVNWKTEVHIDDITAATRRTTATCNEQDSKYMPLDISGQNHTEESDAAACQA